MDDPDYVLRMYDLFCQLVVDEPWSWSNEGLDDCCMFCGSTHRHYNGRGHDYHHDLACPWLAAMDFLGREHPDHDGNAPVPFLDVRDF